MQPMLLETWLCPDPLGELKRFPHASRTKTGGDKEEGTGRGRRNKDKRNGKENGRGKWEV